MVGSVRPLRRPVIPLGVPGKWDRDISLGLGCLLIFLGLIITIRGLCITNERIKIGSLRPLLAVSGAALSFGFLLRPVGLLAGILSLVFLTSLGGNEFRFRDVLILFLVLSAIGTGLFVFALGLPYPLFWNR